jgi:hypothetical protein
VQDEFAGIPSSGQRHPVVALATAALAGFLIFQLRSDIGFALSSSTPRDVGDARALAGTPADRLPLNRTVRISGRADRESGVILDTQGSWRFTQFFRLLGTGSRVFVMRSPDPLSAEQAGKDVFVGRLERFSELSFQSAIRKYFAGHVSATHFFALDALRSALAAAGPRVLSDTLGDKVTLAPNDELAVDVSRPGEIVLEFPRERFACADDARAAVEKEGGRIVEVPVPAPGSRDVSLVVTFPEQRRDPALHALEKLDRRIRLRPARATHRVRVADVTAGANGLVLGRAKDALDLPADRILSIRTLAAVEIPGDALLLREGDRPRDHYKTLMVAAFLLGFAVVNLLALRRRE